MNPRVARVVAAAETQYPAIVIANDRHFCQPEKPRGRGTEVYTDKDLCRERGRRSRTAQTSVSASPSWVHARKGNVSRRRPNRIEYTKEAKEDPGLDTGGNRHHILHGQAKPYTDRYRPVLDDKCARDKGTGSSRGEAKNVCSAKRQDECEDNAPSKRTTGRPERFHDCRRFHIQRRVSTRKGINRYPQKTRP